MRAYKATRPDGTDFRTGTIDYSVIGSTVRHPGRSARVHDDPSTYLSVSTEPAETLIGGSWPCRPFEVEVGNPLDGLSASKYKRAVKSMKIVREVDSTLALGPNGGQVASVIEKIQHATAGKIQALGAARSAARSAARDAGRSAAWDAAWDAGRSAAWDAVWATLVFDLISEDQFQLLAGPYILVFGDPRES